MRKFKSMLVLISVIVASLCLFCAACWNGVNTDWSGVCDIKSAYENNYLTKSDLEKIAEYHNNNKDCETPLRTGDALAIKKELAEDFNKNKVEGFESIEATAEDFEITHYYGTYYGCYIVLIRIKSRLRPFESPDMPINYSVIIGDVVFDFGNDDYLNVIKFNSNKNNGGNLI